MRVTLFSFLCAAQSAIAHAGGDPFSYLEGKWTPTEGGGGNIGAPVLFQKAFGGWDAWFDWWGRTTISKASDYASHIRIDGSHGEKCYYYVSLLDNNRMAWNLRHRDEGTCPESLVFERLEQTLPSDGRFDNVIVAYYQKPADGAKVLSALQQQSIPFSTYRSFEGHDTLPTNGIRCGPNTPVVSLRKLALTLIDAGVDLKIIDTNQNIHASQLLILNFANEDFSPIDTPSLTREQILNLTECPSYLHN